MIRRRSLLLMAPGQLCWVEKSLPDLKSHEIVVRTLAGAISIGTELPLYRGSHRASQAVTYPKMTGYESFAEVVACGKDVQQVTVGDHVVAFYGHRTHAVLEEARVVRVPAAISAPLALLVILSCEVTKGIMKLELQPDESVLVTGAGTIGLLTVFNLCARGQQHVDVIDPLPGRRALAQELGARVAVAPHESAALSAPYHAGIKCSSRDAAFALLQRSVAHAGRLCVLADGNVEPLTLTPAFHEKELEVVGSSDGEGYHGHARWVWPQAESFAAQLEKIFELTTSAEALENTFAEIAASDEPPIKVLVRYT